ncbi:MAG: DUF4352 domain-containing protein [Actinomycetia bacterium]|nr:DUF4352 domain-containing protein [Actinomycetes bacterium]
MTDQPPSSAPRPDHRKAAADRLATGRARERARLEEALADEADDGIDWDAVRPAEEVNLGDGDLSRWAGPALTVAAVVAIAAVAWMIVGRGSDDTGPNTDVAPAAGVETVTDSAPQPLGQPVQLGDWTITVSAWDPNATATVQARNPNNRTPEAGEMFGLATVELARTGSQSGDGFDLSFRLADDAGVEYPDYDSRCGVVPEGLDKFIELAPGDTTTGALCFALPVDKQGLVDLMIGPAVDLDATAVVFDLP